MKCNKIIPLFVKITAVCSAAVISVNVLKMLLFSISMFLTITVVVRIRKREEPFSLYYL